VDVEVYFEIDVVDAEVYFAVDVVDVEVYFAVDIEAKLVGDVAKWVVDGVAESVVDEHFVVAAANDVEVPLVVDDIEEPPVVDTVPTTVYAASPVDVEVVDIDSLSVFADIEVSVEASPRRI
jgi:hypothetical protein